MHFLSTYGLFLLKLVSTVIAILLLLAGIIALATKEKKRGKGKLSIKSLNEKYDAYSETIFTALSEKHKFKALQKAIKARKPKKSKTSKGETRKRLFVLNFHGDIRASQVGALSEEITAVLLTANPKEDEVLIRLESGGGIVNAYGLAASQLNRIKTAKIPLTIAVDKVAASGGYMMACVADHLIAAPFAIIGSIGVLAQLPNFHDYLKEKHINWEQITAGEYKRTLTVFGENTEKGREKMQEEVDETHDLFKSFIKQHRSEVLMEKAATGEHWFAEKAKEYNLVDEINTSDDFLLAKQKATDIYEIKYDIKKSFPERLAARGTKLWDKVIELTAIKAK